MVDTYPYMVDRDKLRKAVSCGHSRGPKHMLKKVVHLVFTDEELANSCGQGIYGTADAEGKEPLDKMKIAACKGNLPFSTLYGLDFFL